MRKTTGHRIDEELLENYQFSDHMQMRYEVVDETGKLIKAGRNLEELKKQSLIKLQRALTNLQNNSMERSNIIEWDFDTLPETEVMDVSGMKLKLGLHLWIMEKCLDKTFRFATASTTSKWFITIDFAQI